MTANRSQKAEVRAFAAERNISYSEARRLIGLVKLRWDHTDAASGVRIQATLAHGNELELLWFYPDGGKGWRFTRVQDLLGIGSWRKRSEFAEPLLTASGELRSDHSTGLNLPASLTERVRKWVGSVVQAPELLSQDEERFVQQGREPVDGVVTVVDKLAKTGVVHVYRSGMAQAPDDEPMAVLDARSARVEALSERLNAHLRSQIKDLDDRSRYYVLEGNSAAESPLEHALHIQSFVVKEELRHLRAKHGVDPDEVKWSVVEHLDF